jgi:hypothetical protein
MLVSLAPSACIEHWQVLVLYVLVGMLSGLVPSPGHHLLLHGASLRACRALVAPHAVVVYYTS